MINIDKQINCANEDTIHKLFRKQAAKTPNAIALIYKDKTMTYNLLDQMSEKVAVLLQKKGVTENDAVAIMTDRSFDLVIGILGILKSGAGYVPLDMTYPIERLEFMLKDSESKFLLTKKSGVKLNNFSGKIIFMDDENIYNNDYIINDNTTRSNLAYIMYTSGSTGYPKGVMIEHKSIINLINGVSEIIDFSPGKTILAIATVCFDISIIELLVSIIKGLKVVIADDIEQNNVRLIRKLIVDNKVNIIQLTPSRLKMLLNLNNDIDYYESVTDLMIGGEQFPVEILQNVKKVFRSKIYNVYGPTETTIWSLIGDLTKLDSINIGHPILNTRIFIMDENMREVPNGHIGEMCIAGDGLARGYKNLESITADKFVEISFENKKILLYKTGDLAKKNNDGCYECLGRIDDQIKIRGYRIEPKEIEKNILDSNNVTDAVVIENNGRIYCFIIPQNVISIDDISDNLIKKIPKYMIPSKYIIIDEIPMTLNYKIDKKKLQKLIIDSEKLHVDDKSYLDNNNNDIIKIDLGNEIYNKVFNIIKQCVDNVNNNCIAKTLYEIGIDSVLFIKVVVDIENEFNIEIDMNSLYFTNKLTIDDIVNYIKNNLQEGQKA